jgi:hypothetical protein
VLYHNTATRQMTRCQFTDRRMAHERPLSALSMIADRVCQ